MRRVFLFLIAITVSGILYGQSFSVEEFLELPDMSSRKFASYISKMKLVATGRFLTKDTVMDTWRQAIRLKQIDSNIVQIERRLAKYEIGKKDLAYCFQTTSKEEYVVAVTKLKSQGFFCGEQNLLADTALLFQQKNSIINAYPLKEDTVVFYTLFFLNKNIPPANSVKYGEDLLQFTSHEFLVSFFGEKSVSKDLYYFSAREINKCSVLFPNTPRQAVFIWDDEKNLTNLSHIIIGGVFRTAGTTGFNQQIWENTWELHSGLRFNMRLEQLMELNNADIDFYGRSSDYYLMVLPQRKGEVDFTKVGVVLDCINCDGSSLLDKKTISATEAVDNNLRLHVAMIMLMPASAETATPIAGR
jgi:hypothetical protein